MSKYTVKQLADRIADGAEQLVQDGAWDEYLKFISRFPGYSFGNLMLIYTARPDASRVAGYRTWQKMGRQVRKGEKGIAILAPHQWKRKDEDDDQDVSRRTGVGFHVTYVRDVSQTDGDPLPEIAPPLSGDDPNGILGQVLGAIKRRGLVVEFTDEMVADGATNGRTVRLHTERAATHQVAVALHELAHVILGHTSNRRDVPQAAMEWEAESVSYVVCERLGIDSSTNALGYVLSWAHGDPEAVREYIAEEGNLILTVASEIVEAVAVNA